MGIHSARKAVLYKQAPREWSEQINYTKLQLQIQAGVTTGRQGKKELEVSD